jgi:Ca2+-transporting ATPase
LEFYQKSAKESIEFLGSSMQGLTKKQVQGRLDKYGFNELTKEKKNILLNILASQFKDFLVILLMVAGVLSFVLGDVVEAIAILVMVLLSVILGFFQEYKAEKSLEKLQKITSRKAIVLRQGEETKIDAIELVPGDIVILEAGSIVPADVRLIDCSSLKVDESSLTGESQHSFKDSNVIKKEVTVADQENMAFMGTVVVYGKAKGIVVKTGMRTEFGKIAHSLTEVSNVKTPMKKKLAKLGSQILAALIVICVIIFISSFLKGTLTMDQALLVALSLAVAAAPSSLPAIVTISLSKGVMALSKKQMLVKKLPAAEGLGSATFICSDKTGTLTKNEMSVKQVFCNNKSLKVEGIGYTNEGGILYNNKAITKKDIQKLLDVAVICNDSELVMKTPAPYKSLDANTGMLEEVFDIIGDPTEISLHVLAGKVNVNRSSALQNYRVIQELPFDSDRKLMSVIVETKNNKTESLTKGAPNILLSKCKKILINNKVKKLSSTQKKKILQSLNSMENSALRVLAFAYRPLKNKKNEYSIKEVEKDMIFVGLAGMIDPPRESVKSSIQFCRDAGIDVMMITGDSPRTAKAIGKSIGLLKEGDEIITGVDLNQINDQELQKRIAKIRICARFLPIQKLRIVNALQKKGHIVAMTGDGVNDAPALKKSDLGIAMGITGTDVAKEVSEMTLADDNFSTIVAAIEEGRNIYDKMLKSIKYLLTCNAGEVLTVFVALLLNFPIPLLPLQILLMNLLTDGLPALALSAEPIDHTVMSRPPRDPKEKPVNSGMLALILIFGGLMAAGTLFLFDKFYTQTNDLVLAQTIAFTSLVAFEMFAVISSRKLYKLSFSKGFFSNPYLHLAIFSSVALQFAVVYIPFLQNIFGTTALSLIHWVYIVGVAFIGFIVMEVSKLFIKYEKRKN